MTAGELGVVRNLGGIPPRNSLLKRHHGRSHLFLHILRSLRTLHFLLVTLVLREIRIHLIHGIPIHWGTRMIHITQMTRLPMRESGTERLMLQRQ